ncbi:MAG: DNA methyltransferase, partial [Patescibacteria group bacterium]|nr:DNA methyltransferase [Patescibacteria group bacterium]
MSNKLLDLIKNNYPSIIKNGNINLEELKKVLQLPIEGDETYGLNFIGKKYAINKYKEETNKTLKLNTSLSKNVDNTQNLVLVGDNLECMKILRKEYSGKIKCIYIDPPYNTGNNFVYSDNFSKDEKAILKLNNLKPENKSKKSHNGWLTFMYPRLLLARDLLS